MATGAYLTNDGISISYQYGIWFAGMSHKTKMQALLLPIKLSRTGNQVKTRKTAERKIRGIIIPVEWDDDGNVISTTIHTDNEEEYLIDQNKKGEELLAFIHHKVEVTGKLREGAYGNAIINVRRYRLIGTNHDKREVHA
jgi:hypothetical protein